MMKLLKNWFLPTSSSTKSVFTNKDLLHELVTCFSINLESESVGNRMLYPTSFNVLLNPTDFAAREDALPFVVQEIVNTFYKIIKDKSGEYPDYSPPSKYWNFQFSPCEELVVNEKMKINIPEGAPYIMAKLYTTSLSNTTSTANTRVSFKPKNSDTYSTFNINQDVFKSIDVVATGVFAIKFDPALTQITNRPNHLGNETFAELSFTKGGNLIHFAMIDKEIVISGNKDTRKESWVLSLDTDQIQNTHASIKYDGATGDFYISAFGPLKVNERTVEQSTGGDIKWYKLSRKAKLLINNFFIVEFQSKK